MERGIIRISAAVGVGGLFRQEKRGAQVRQELAPFALRRPLPAGQCAAAVLSPHIPAQPLLALPCEAGKRPGALPITFFPDRRLAPCRATG